MATEVAVINASSGVSTFYSTYAAARSAASSGDTIQVWADLADEQILLKDGVDLWFAPGRIIETSEGYPLIIDNDSVYTSPVAANLTGNAIFRNSNDKYRCVLISNSGSKISIQCDSLEATGTDPNETEYATVHIENASTFYLTCNKVTNTNQRAIYFANEVGDININAIVIENGEFDGGDAVTIRGTGFLTANEVISKNDGGCLVHKAGSLIATVLKLTTIDSDIETSATVQLTGGTGTQNLTLYFDEIQNSSTGGGDAVKIDEGRANVIGRRIYSTSGLALNLIDDIISANFQCVDIISNGRCIEISNDDEQIIIDANYIEGYTAETDGVVYCSSGGNFLLRNMKIKNLNSGGTNSPYSMGIYLGTGTINMMIENIIVVTSELSSTSKTIVSASSRDVKNLGLFVNKAISSNITLKIGTEVVTGNYKYIISADVT